MVLRVDKDKGYIDLSKRRVSPEDLAVRPPCCPAAAAAAAGLLAVVLLWAVGCLPGCMLCLLGRAAAVCCVPCCVALRGRPLALPLTLPLPPPPRVRPQKCEDRFAKSKLVHSIMRHVAETTGCDLEQLYGEVAWPLYRMHGHAYNAFASMVRGVWVVCGGWHGCHGSRACAVCRCCACWAALTPRLAGMV